MLRAKGKVRRAHFGMPAATKAKSEERRAKGNPDSYREWNACGKNQEAEELKAKDGYAAFFGGRAVPIAIGTRPSEVNSEELSAKSKGQSR